MGVFLNLVFLFLLFLLLHITTLLSFVVEPCNAAEYDIVFKEGGAGDIAKSYPSSSPPDDRHPLLLPPTTTDSSPLKPGVAIVVAILTTMFSITFLYLLYAKHCRHGRGTISNGTRAPPPLSSSRNSGIERSVIESLPIFRFASLMGQKEGLECAVCLNRFEPTEILRLLPKCKHAFHVECVDTWLDAHSTCPLCRYRVDPEDVLLVNDANNVFNGNHPLPLPPPHPEVLMEKENENNDVVLDLGDGSNPGFRRISGRHSSAGENRSGVLLQAGLHVLPGSRGPTSFRMSLDSAELRKKSEAEPVAVGCFDRPRKDGLLMSREDGTGTGIGERGSRFEHRIIVSPGSSGGGFHQRWSDVHASDLLYLRSELIMSDNRRFSSASGSRCHRHQHQQQQQHLPLHWNREGSRNSNSSIDGTNRWYGGGRNVINSRSVSEITGLSRLPNSNGGVISNSTNSNNNISHSHSHSQRQRQEQQRQAGVLSRWWSAWISQSRPAVRSGRTPAPAIAP